MLYIQCYTKGLQIKIIKTKYFKYVYFIYINKKKNQLKSVLNKNTSHIYIILKYKCRKRLKLK